MLRPFTDADLADVHTIQLKCPQAAQWREEDYLRLAGDDAGMILVAEPDGGSAPEIVGFAAFYRIGDEAEVRNVAVDPAQQRRGIARLLFAEGLRLLRGVGVRRVFLEVRASNRPARNLYEALGFRLLYGRRNYYHNPDDDALVMACDITFSSEKQGSIEN